MTSSAAARCTRSSSVSGSGPNRAVSIWSESGSVDLSPGTRRGHLRDDGRHQRVALGVGRQVEGVGDAVAGGRRSTASAAPRSRGALVEPAPPGAPSRSRAPAPAAARYRCAEPAGPAQRAASTAATAMQRRAPSQDGGGEQVERRRPGAGLALLLRLAQLGRRAAVGALRIGDREVGVGRAVAAEVGRRRARVEAGLLEHPRPGSSPCRSSHITRGAADEQPDGEPGVAVLADAVVAERVGRPDQRHRGAEVRHPEHASPRSTGRAAPRRRTRCAAPRPGRLRPRAGTAQPGNAVVLVHRLPATRAASRPRASVPSSGRTSTTGVLAGISLSIRR